MFGVIDSFIHDIRAEILRTEEEEFVELDIIKADEGLKRKIKQRLWRLWNIIFYVGQ